jgi:Ni/Co efflux regulator RcnB
VQKKITLCTLALALTPAVAWANCPPKCPAPAQQRVQQQVRAQPQFRPQPQVQPQREIQAQPQFRPQQQFQPQQQIQEQPQFRPQQQMQAERPSNVPHSFGGSEGARSFGQNVEKPSATGERQFGEATRGPGEETRSFGQAGHSNAGQARGFGQSLGSAGATGARGFGEASRNFGGGQRKFGAAEPNVAGQNRSFGGQARSLFGGSARSGDSRSAAARSFENARSFGVASHSGPALGHVALAAGGIGAGALAFHALANGSRAGSRPAFIPSGGAHQAATTAKNLQLADARPPRSTTGRSFIYGGQSHPSFVVDRYTWPRGFHFAYIPVGGFLPAALWAPNYFVENYGYYGVAPPPANFSWIRYGPDLVLINLDTGEIAQEILGAFQDIGDDAPGVGPLPAYAREQSFYRDPDELPGDPAPPGDN